MGCYNKLKKKASQRNIEFASFSKKFLNLDEALRPISERKHYYCNKIKECDLINSQIFPLSYLFLTLTFFLFLELNFSYEKMKTLSAMCQFLESASLLSFKSLLICTIYFSKRVKNVYIIALSEVKKWQILQKIAQMELSLYFEAPTLTPQIYSSFQWSSSFKFPQIPSSLIYQFTLTLIYSENHLLAY